MLDAAECERARVGRDPAYDGRFFTGVRTTRIYCRPVCPVRPARAANVGFYPSAAAAEAAGFRPCLRCRPETAPFSPAWNGSRTTADRATRLIAEGALDEEGASIDVLAARLGIGARHLSPVHETCRRQPHTGCADCPGTKGQEIVGRHRPINDRNRVTRGVRKLRSFNAVFAEIYRKPPTAIRRRGSGSSADTEGNHGPVAPS